MYLTITRFAVADTLSRSELTRMFEQSAPRYAALPGLLSKHYYVDDDGSAGGVYLWGSREKADAFLDASFQESIRQRFGSLPTVQALHCPISLDNVHQTRLAD